LLIRIFIAQIRSYAKCALDFFRKYWNTIIRGGTRTFFRIFGCYFWYKIYSRWTLSEFCKKKELLLVKYSATQSEEESIVSINFVEYLTGRSVASCRGAFGLGWTKEQDMDIAVNNVLEQMKKLF
jgi:hypothetical protein